MKLTLAMGLQYDNSKQASMVALSLGQGNDPSKLREHESVTAHPIESDRKQSGRAIPWQQQLARLESDHPELPVVESMQAPIAETKKGTAPFYLTYNLKGLSDTLVFDHALVDVFV